MLYHPDSMRPLAGKHERHLHSSGADIPTIVNPLRKAETLAAAVYTGDRRSKLAVQISRVGCHHGETAAPWHRPSQHPSTLHERIA